MSHTTARDSWAVTAVLSPLDDFPIHQVVEPVRRVGTSDRNFYDRYYFNCHAGSPDLFLVTGMGQYPNLSVTDAFATLHRGGEQLAVRASRELGADRMDTTVGPFRIEVVEGLRELRVVLEPNEWGLEFDLTFTGAVPAVLEPRHELRQHGRTIVDSNRLAQTGCWSGTLTVDGVTSEVTPDRWWGTRDRSWGIRPVGDPEPPGIGAAKEPGSFYWVYAPLQFPDFSIITIAQEDARGHRSLEEAVRVWPEASGREVEYLGRPEITIDFVPGTREVGAATLGFADGTSVTVETQVPLALGAGGGYGTDDWRHGMYLGEQAVVQGGTYDVSDAPKRAAYWSVTDNLVRARCGNHAGWGMFEFACFGPHEPSGFTGWDDVAP
ncbi:hypothetical protein H0B56_15600 [Haloechinothrix sp. YIM 98757]|uniref:Tocopherol cyclase n=1 Tax=Haloechinothrix aidingensis TaxID=2752311 RepID=A0A838ACI7_9PSEU|nr:hypothetical protein [Haloechinothrix aidingensis]MBA0126974.1 hypothetical protein [Haloechinothrix aidingensis]